MTVSLKKSFKGFSHATKRFGPVRSDRSVSVQPDTTIGPVRSVQASFSWTDRTGPRPNRDRGCASLLPLTSYKVIPILITHFSFFYRVPTQRLRKTVCRHFLCGNILQPNDLVHNCIPDEVVTNVDVFGFSVANQILCESDRTLIVGAEDHCLFSWTLTEFRKELSHPFELLCGFCKSHILCLCRRQSDGNLTFASPCNCAIVQYYNVSSS